MTSKVCFITGASKGFGRILVQQLLAKGYKVAASSRTIDGFDQEMKHHPHFLPVEIKNLANFPEVHRAIQTTISAFGSLDVVINNAGYGQVGPFEETADEKIRRNFEVNVFGTMTVVKAALPQMRAQKAGKIVNFSSTAGFYGFPLSSVYVAAKHAIDGFSESLNHELNPIGIKVMSVLPGNFRTNFLSAGSLQWADTNTISEYDALREEQRTNLTNGDKMQEGDPEKGMQVVIEAIESDLMPIHLTLGSDAYLLREEKAEQIKEELVRWEKLAVQTDFD
ncbi:SDR family oxidoreductase [Enterococcus casseliflavus]|uniref:SDR family oxidoreductase n=1 Tax=Enterococcus casseliflavus TaxID=37734 RepID=UPI003D0F6D63